VVKASRGASAGQIYARLQLRGGLSASWFAILSARGSSRALHRFCEDLSVLLGFTCRLINCKNSPIESLIERVQNPSVDAVMLAGLEEWQSAEWAALDLNRSRFERGGPLIFWLSERAVTQMFQHAPNVRSYLASSVFRLDADKAELDEAERLKRLGELYERFDLTDDEVVRRAEEGMLSVSPSFVEWLILLGRGDLV